MPCQFLVLYHTIIQLTIGGQGYPRPISTVGGVMNLGNYKTLSANSVNFRALGKRKDLVFRVLFLFCGVLLVIVLCHFNLARVPETLFEDRRTWADEVCEHNSYLSGQTTKEILSGRLHTTSTQRGLSKYQLKHLFVDKVHKVLYCFVPKAGCTNWKRIMLMLTGRMNVSLPIDIPRSTAHKYQL